MSSFTLSLMISMQFHRLLSLTLGINGGIHSLPPKATDIVADVIATNTSGSFEVASQAVTLMGGYNWRIALSSPPEDEVIDVKTIAEIACESIRS